MNLKRNCALRVWAVATCLSLGCRESGTLQNYEPRAVSTVLSSQLSETAIVPCLDTPIGESGNAVWCATFQVAWNHAKDDVIGGPIRVSNAQTIADRLNNSPVAEAVLPPNTFYATAGRFEDGIANSIRTDMAQMFSQVTPRTVDGDTGFVAYAYLDTKSSFTTPFVGTENPIPFSDAAGVVHSLMGFGLHEGTDWKLRKKQAKQVKVLFTESQPGSMDQSRLSAFALDLTADQDDKQIILAVVPRADSLNAIWDDVQRRTENLPKPLRELRMSDCLAIPNVAFRVDHEFSELQGKQIANQGEFRGLPVVKAMQSIHFRLDRSGASVLSESNSAVGATPRQFIVDRPFLIVMKRRQARQPYFVAWIDNTELLEPSDGDR